MHQPYSTHGIVQTRHTSFPNASSKTKGASSTSKGFKLFISLHVWFDASSCHPRQTLAHRAESSRSLKEKILSSTSEIAKTRFDASFIDPRRPILSKKERQSGDCLLSRQESEPACRDGGFGSRFGLVITCQ